MLASRVQCRKSTQTKAGEADDIASSHVGLKLKLVHIIYKFLQALSPKVPVMKFGSNIIKQLCYSKYYQ
jgi:hypothetical protein